MTEEQQEQLGAQIVTMLHLRILKGTTDRYDTAWGTKTKRGLGATVERLIKEIVEGSQS